MQVTSGHQSLLMKILGGSSVVDSVYLDWPAVIGTVPFIRTFFFFWASIKMRHIFRAHDISPSHGALWVSVVNHLLSKLLKINQRTIIPSYDMWNTNNYHVFASAVMHVCVCARERQITRTNSNNFIKEKEKKWLSVEMNLNMICASSCKMTLLSTTIA